MNPKEKAKELFNKMYQADDVEGNYPMCLNTAKQCALIAVDEIINILSKDLNPLVNYWFEVKHKLEKL